jgi:enamine deaminase RidA (YjgF/YER057c/UK114 family)
MTDSPHLLLHPRHWKPAIGYANGVAARGRLVFCGGLIGWNADQEFETDDFAGQVAQCLQNVVAVLDCAGARPEHLVRMTWYVTDKRAYLDNLREIGRSYRTIIGKHYPAMALVQVVALVEDRARVEIEATAVVPDPEIAA